MRRILNHVKKNATVVHGSVAEPVGAEVFWLEPELT